MQFSGAAGAFGRVSACLPNNSLYRHLLVAASMPCLDKGENPRAGMWPPGLLLPLTRCHSLPLSVLSTARIELMAGIIPLLGDLQQWPGRSDGTRQTEHFYTSPWTLLSVRATPHSRVWSLGAAAHGRDVVAIHVPVDPVLFLPSVGSSSAGLRVYGGTGKGVCFQPVQTCLTRPFPRCIMRPRTPHGKRAFDLCSTHRCRCASVPMCRPADFTRPQLQP